MLVRQPRASRAKLVRDGRQRRISRLLVTAWFELEHAPTRREIQGDKELSPPLPLASAAGGMRRALLRAAAGGHSVRAAGRMAGRPAPSASRTLAGVNRHTPAEPLVWLTARRVDGSVRSAVAAQRDFTVANIESVAPVG